MNLPAFTDQRLASGAHNAGELRVLLADDERLGGEAMMAMATRLGVEMDVASNGQEAIDMIVRANDEERPYSLLLLDAMMPVLDGIETARRLRLAGFDARQLPIVAVTAATSVEEVRAYRAAGMQAFLSKPVKLDELRATLEAWGHAKQYIGVDIDPGIQAQTISAFSRQFKDRNGRVLAMIEKALRSRKITADRIEEISLYLHQIAGTAMLFGDAALGEAARAHVAELNGALKSEQLDQDTARRHLEAAGESLRQG